MRSGHLGHLWVSLIVAFTAGAVHAQSTEDAVQGVLKTMRGPNLVSGPIAETTPEGYLEYVIAPTGNAFTPGDAAKAAGGADAVAKSFLREHSKAFGIHENVSFTTDRVTTHNARTYVRLNQTYKGIPVFGAQVSMQLRPDGGVTAVQSDVMRNADRVYSGQLSLNPSLSVATARLAAINVVRKEHPNYTIEASEPVLHLYVPYVTGSVGLARLAYVVNVYGSGPGVPADVQLLIDAHTAGVITRIPLVLFAKDRAIYDANNVPFGGAFVEPGNLERIEGGAPSAIGEVNEAYDAYGDTYDFYLNEHSRDSIDGSGMTMEAITRYCPDLFDCPYSNAFWQDFTQRMYFGDGWVIDDVVAHELTHGITSHESGLIYQNESGAINESFSDIWGEFVDLTNGTGLDTPEVRWIIAEEIGGIRSMKNPLDFFCPDVYRGQFWIFDENFDNGGVHFNSGVGNKLCYLLTDGDTFRGFEITPLGMQTTADLFYECQKNLLTFSSDYEDLGNALIQAAQNLGLNASEKAEIAEALFATEIKKFDGLPLRDFRGTGKSGDSRIALTWRVPTAGDYTGVDIVRRTDRFPDHETDGVVIANVTDTQAEQFVDVPGGGAGTDVYYAIFPRPGSFPSNTPQFARATIGVDVDFTTEAFAGGTDMSFSQITYVPTGPVPVTGPAVHLPEKYFNYTTYTSHVTTSGKISPSFDGHLPVDSEGAFIFAMGDDTTITLTPPVPVPFFGRFLNSLVLSSNGYIAASVEQYQASPSPTLEDHFAVPRISFLYSDLDPRSGGMVWTKFLDDRVVITFEDVPSYDQSSLFPGSSFANTVQCELFHGGQIRFTYLGLTAERAIIGLSDGNGVPLEVDSVLAGTSAGPQLTDLTSIPESIPLELQPVPVQFVERGDIVSFTAVALSNVGAPSFSSIPLPDELDVGEMTGATLNPTTGEFQWDSSGFPLGVYGMVLCATAGGVSSCQTVGVVVSSTDVDPVAINVTLNPDEPRDSDNLVANYGYSHPSLPEGPTTIYWLRNGAVIPAHTNQTVVSRHDTKPGEQWCFQVLPTTVQVGSIGSENVYLFGEMVQSPTVTILPDLKVDTNGDGKVNSVDLQLVVRGLLGTGQPGIDPDVNGDGVEDAADIQSTVNFILDKKN